MESNEHFAEFNIIQAITPLQRPTNIYLGHIDEYHYVSTLPCSTMPNLVENQSTEKFSTNKLPDQNIKNSRNAYMKEYKKRKQLTKDPKTKQKSNEYMKEYMKGKRLTKDPQSKQKSNEYMKEYMKAKRLTKDPQSKQKNNEYMKQYMKQKRSEPQNQSLQSLILKFHKIVSEGPLYVCSCCDQLWYKHSVSSATALKKLILVLKKIFSIKQVLIMLNGCADHVIVT